MNFLVQGLKFIILLASSLLGLKCCAVIDPTFSLSFPYCRSFSFPLFFHALETHVFTVSQKKNPFGFFNEKCSHVRNGRPPKKGLLEQGLSGCRKKLSQSARWFRPRVEAGTGDSVLREYLLRSRPHLPYARGPRSTPDDVMRCHSLCRLIDPPRAWCRWLSWLTCVWVSTRRREERMSLMCVT